jgi:hypothetical protein
MIHSLVVWGENPFLLIMPYYKMIVNHLTTHNRLRKYTLSAYMEIKTTAPNAMIIPIV